MVQPAVIPQNAYVGNGSANAFAFNFPVFASTNLLVEVLNTQTGVFDTLVLGTDYSVSGLAINYATTGTITLISAGQAWLSGANLATNWTLTIVINNPLAQTYSIRNGGDFYRNFLENALDYEMQCIQQLQVQGYVLTDVITGSNYRLIMVNGVLSQVQIS